MILTTQKQVDRMKTPGKYRCGPNLYLQVESAKAKSYFFRWWKDGQELTMGLGSAGTWSRNEMLEVARVHRQCVAQGGNPKEERDRQLQAVLAKMSFKDCAEAYVKAHADGWKNAKHRDQVANTLTTYVFPIIGSMPVDTVTTPDVLRVLEQPYRGGTFWRNCGPTASRTRNRIESVLSYASARGLRSGDNVARWAGHLDHILPEQTSGGHHAAMDFRAISSFMVELRARDSVVARALETLILCASRTQEVTGARWSEIDTAAKVWTISAARTKTGVEHRIPLAPRVLEIFKGLPRESDFIFPGTRTGAGLSGNVMAQLLGRMRDGGLTCHGFRSTFRTWSAEQTSFPHEVLEQALGHAIGNAVERAYQRGDLIEKRRLLMTAWAQYCERDHDADNVVTAMRGR